MNEMANRMHVAQPKPRDHAVRAPHIPASVLAARAREQAGIPAEARKTEKQLEVSCCCTAWPERPAESC